MLCGGARNPTRSVVLRARCWHAHGTVVSRARQASMRTAARRTRSHTRRTKNGTPKTPAGTKPAGKVSTAADVAAGPCAINCWNQGEIYSFHTGVANVALSDATTRSQVATS